MPLLLPSWKRFETLFLLLFTPSVFIHTRTHTHIWNLDGRDLLLSRQLIVLVNNYPKANSLCIFSLFLGKKNFYVWWSLQCTIALHAETCISYKHAYINICYIKHTKHKWKECMQLETSSWLKIGIAINYFGDGGIFSMYNCNPVLEEYQENQEW